MAGYRSMWHILRSEGFMVPRSEVASIQRELDPDGCEERRTHRLKQRVYINPGPNFCWHMDGYDKLKPFGFPIHGCIDGFSRKMIWLKLSRSNNNPEVKLKFYLDSVREFGGCPQKLWTDYAQKMVQLQGHSVGSCLIWILTYMEPPNTTRGLRDGGPSFAVVE